MVMMRRRADSDSRRGRGIIATGAVVLAAALAGCAGVGEQDTWSGPGPGLGPAPDSGEDPGGKRAVWAAFFSGFDIRLVCGPGHPDLYRMVFVRRGAVADAPPVYQVFELWRHPFDGTGFVDSRTITADERDRFLPADDTAPSFLAVRRKALDRRHLAVLVYWLERQAVFHAPSFLESPGRGAGGSEDRDDFRWLISGCRDGRWFQQSAPAAPPFGAT